MYDVIDEPYYSIGDMKFKTLWSTSEELQQAYRESGFMIEKWEMDGFCLDNDDPRTLYFLVAKNTLQNT